MQLYMQFSRQYVEADDLVVRDENDTYWKLESDTETGKAHFIGSQLLIVHANFHRTGSSGILSLDTENIKRYFDWREDVD